MDTKRLTPEEADVIEAADDYWEIQQQAQHIPVAVGQIGSKLNRLLHAVSELHSANDGRWRRPNEV